ncbi:MAG: Hdr-like menaquinol oxidoreductase cytochrome c subunit [Rhodospirillales bacterium]|nr:Hdr-like menaquinol oxidoreductase cytochrome c subunit [Rhodospirillales bacterium]
MIRILLALLIGMSLGGVAQAAEPVVPKAKGERCVEDKRTMRTSHMELLKHQRDLTLRSGVRGTKHALKDCLTCHAVPDAQGQPVGIEDQRHFCNVCHGYAAVRIDCFECHASK